ncbi:hypothetical protein NDU88_005136 [Pleurodeles waltl]|uniref:Uncharacterized protein n=1 Tax=Pleurodeles waltl TaxID=8319 RepID=A0AAV7TT56_PLEWA|nr:hypothetical protein NDU88_005136 [Pleurodeles waltl]
MRRRIRQKDWFLNPLQPHPGSRQIFPALTAPTGGTNKGAEQRRRRWNQGEDDGSSPKTFPTPCRKSRRWRGEQTAMLCEECGLVRYGPVIGRGAINREWWEEGS